MADVYKYFYYRNKNTIFFQAFKQHICNPYSHKPESHCYFWQSLSQSIIINAQILILHLEIPIWIQSPQTTGTHGNNKGFWTSVFTNNFGCFWLTYLTSFLYIWEWKLNYCREVVWTWNAFFYLKSYNI